MGVLLQAIKVVIPLAVVYTVCMETATLEQQTPKTKRQMLGLPPRPCRNPTCKIEFTPNWKNQEHHSKECREEFYAPLDPDLPESQNRIRVILSKLDGSHPFFKAVQSAVQAKIGARGNQSSKRKLKK